MKVLFVLNFPSPYRVAFLNELGKSMEVTAVFDQNEKQQTDRPASWKDWFENDYQTFTALFLKSSWDILPFLKKGRFDSIVLGGYTQKTAMIAIEYMHLRKIPFWIEADGGMVKPDNPIKYRVKKHFIERATRWFATGPTVADYFTHYGADKSRIDLYPFSSLHEAEILSVLPTSEEKTALRKKLGLQGKHITLGVGQFIPRKGFDLLLKAWANLPLEETLCIVGQDAPREYLDLKESLHLENVQFVGFRKKEALWDYYKAADLFVLPTREDIWGLVINEAMACGLPVITTRNCVAGVELVENGVNGYVVPNEDIMALQEKIEWVLQEDALRETMGKANLEKIKPYTIENMARVHEKVLREAEQGKK